MAGSISGEMTADNAFFAYISTNDSVLGTLVASENNWGGTASFSNFALTPGVTYYLHVEAINYGGAAGFIGQFDLSGTGFQFANGTQDLLTDTTDWRGIYNNGSGAVTAQPWVEPTGGVASLGANGIGPWGTRPGISGNADWIWPSDADSMPGGGLCGNCTVDFSTPIETVSGAPEPPSMWLMGTALLASCFLRHMLRDN